MSARCPRCAAPLDVERDLPCLGCWDGRAGAGLVRLLVLRAEDGSPHARRLLGSIGDADALQLLRQVATHDDPLIRAAAIASLGLSGDELDVPLAVAALDDDHVDVREAARATLADLGGTDSADALANSLDGLSDEELTGALEALAWLGDQRALPPLHALLPDVLASGEIRPRGIAWAIVQAGSDDDVQRVMDAVERIAAEAQAGTRPLEAGRVVQGINQVRRAVGDRPELWDAYTLLTGRPGPGAGGPPVQDQRVPPFTLAELRRHPVPAAGWPPPKFGGQPDWVDEPAWPLGSDGTPLVFYGQLPVPAGGQGRTAYIFIDVEGQHWEPLGQANALIVQPGVPCQLETGAFPVGPQLFENAGEPHGLRRRDWRRRPYERFVRLEAGESPASQHQIWNKLGGVPRFLQGDEWPPGAEWEFAFQFSAGWAGRDLGDGAECYGFVRGDGTGAFLWQCH